MDDLCLPANYRRRPAVNDNLKTTDHAQNRVYQFAAHVAAGDPAVRSVLDWGCGTGWKLVNYFGHLNTLGADVDYRLPVLSARFPNRRWGVCPVAVDADLVLCVDVIEHVDDPLGLLRTFAAGRWRHLILSTPEREQVARLKCRTEAERWQQRHGPPVNRWHAMEWTADEFRQLLRREFGSKPTVKILGRWNLVAHLTRTQASGDVSGWSGLI
jgi:hypothetical protein